MPILGGVKTLDIREYGDLTAGLRPFLSISNSVGPAEKGRAPPAIDEPDVDELGECMDIVERGTGMAVAGV